jgi:hypothetical protein
MTYLKELLAHLQAQVELQRALDHLHGAGELRLIGDEL